MSQAFYISIPPSQINPDDTREQELIRDTIIDIETKRQNLSTKFDTKLLEVQNEFYLHRYDDDELQKELDREIEKQKQNNEEEARFLLTENTKKVQDVLKLSNDVKKMQTDLLKNVKSYNNIKSLNGQDLAISNIKDTNDYLIHINNKCLTTDSNKNYNLSECSYNDFSQRFTINPVSDNNSYTKEYGFKPQVSEIRSYPYNLVKSKLNGLCLEENNGSVFLNNCQSLNGQKWRGMQSKKK